MLFNGADCVEFAINFVTFVEEQVVKFKTWVCEVCGYIYNEVEGDEEHGLAPGTRWQDVPDDWECPDCGAGKSEFEMREA
jgi:rubredoxin